MTKQHASADLDALLRWENAGAAWRILTFRHQTMTISLCRCDEGEELDRLVSDEPDLIQYALERAESTGDGPRYPAS